MARRAASDQQCANEIGRLMQGSAGCVLLLWAMLGAHFPAQAQDIICYVGELGSDHVTIAWGTTAGDNTIGRSSRSMGDARLRVGTQELNVADRNWALINNLQADTEYDYELSVNG